MSFITLDFKCVECGRSEERFIKRGEVENQVCPDCQVFMKRLPAGPITTFRFGDRAAIKSKKAVSLRD